MKDAFELIAEERKILGKGESRRLRRGNRIPAVIYGGDAPPQSLVLDHNAVAKHLEQEAFYSHILTLRVAGREEKVVLRDLQRHPSKPRILHLDLQRISATETIRMRVPLHFMGEDMAPGVKQSGGIISHLINEVEVSCLAEDLPEFIEVDISMLKLGEAVHLSDLKLPSNVELIAFIHGAEQDQPVATIHLPRVAVEETEAPEEAAAQPGAEGEPKAS